MIKKTNHQKKSMAVQFFTGIGPNVSIDVRNQVAKNEFRK
jgi:hypothetical protein